MELSKDDIARRLEWLDGQRAAVIRERDNANRLCKERLRKITNLKSRVGRGEIVTVVEQGFELYSGKAADETGVRS